MIPTCVRCDSPSMHAINACCSSHGKHLCHACYRRTHFVEVCSPSCLACENEGLAPRIDPMKLPGADEAVANALQIAADRESGWAELIAERDEARAEVVRLGKQVQQAQHAHDGLVNLLADGKTIAASDLSHLFDALFPKWSETS